jgi:glycosyltransferase involved in cell wall biosynthesis
LFSGGEALVKLLLIAPTCDGEDVGEAWVAYQWAKLLAARHQVTLLTYYKRGRTPASAQLSGLDVIEWPEPPGFGRLERLNSILKPAYIPFYFRARAWIRRALASGMRFDVAHQPLPVAMRYPSPLTGSGLPYILGPVGGSLEEPQGFAGERETAPRYVALRKLDPLRLRYDPMLRRSYEEASCVVGIAPYVADALAELSLQRLEFMSETGVDTLPPLVDRSQRSGAVRLLFVGRLIKTKGVREAVGALKYLRDLPLSLDVVGDGFDRATCEQIARDSGVAETVRFHGRKPRRDVDAFYENADIFVFPSYREPGGNAPFEAMAWGLPLIVCNRGGPAAAVDESCGILIEPENPEQLSKDIAGAVRRLVAKRDLRLSLGAGARARAARVGMWDARIEGMEHIYEQVLMDRARPSGAGNLRWPRRGDAAPAAGERGDGLH